MREPDEPGPDVRGAELSSPRAGAARRACPGLESLDSGQSPALRAPERLAPPVLPEAPLRDDEGLPARPAPADPLPAAFLPARPPSLLYEPR